MGFSFESFDCLAHFNLPAIKKLLTENLPGQSCNTAALIVELTNFDKYKMLIDQFSQGSSKSKKDLTEMRFIQTFQHCLQKLEARLQQRRESKVIIVATCEKQGDIASSFNCLFKEKFAFKNPEKLDRETIVTWLLKNDETVKRQSDRNLDVASMAKFLQGKNFKEIRSILVKVTKSTGQQEEITNEIVQKRLSDLEKERRAFGEKAVRIPEVKWADVGGLANAKEDILQTIMLPIEKPHLFKSMEIAV